ncbi:MAG: molybdopterin-dependent oxidoreductase [Thermodesulfobacteriota bacterium]
MTANQTAATGERTAFRTCPLCEATCGLTITLDGDRVVRVRGDERDVFSRGYFCPKGAALGELHHDPDRLRAPLIRSGGTFREASWDEAFSVVEQGLTGVAVARGKNAVAVYLGNPTVHHMAGVLYVRPLIKALGTRNVYSASTVDQMPKQVSCGLMFGSAAAIPVPDLDRADYLLMLGANPWASNGSLCTAPGFPERLKALRARGGRFVVVDPRRTRTAQEADEHLFIRPGTDPFLLLAMVRTLFVENRVSLGRLAEWVEGLSDLEPLAARFTPEAVAGITGIEAGTVQRLARELAEARSAAVYGRMGTSTVAFGGLTNWLVDVINILTGNLDRPGGAMFPGPAHLPDRTKAGGKGFKIGRWKSRVGGRPEVCGELPIAVLAEEIETPGQDQVRALLTLAGNPVLTTPNGRRLDAALASLDFMVSVDLYLNETTRRAHVILPPPSPLALGHYDFAFYGLSVRNVARYSAPVLPEAGRPDLWEILARLTLIVSGQDAAADPAGLDDFMAAVLAGDRAAEILPRLGGRRGPERLLDLMLRGGPYGLTLDDLLRAPHGLDLGPLAPRLPVIVQTPSGRIQLCPQEIKDDARRLIAALDRGPAEGLVLIGRRRPRSNNSWMHNLPSLAAGPSPCTLMVHPNDADSLDLKDGGSARVSSRVGEVIVPVELSDDVMPGVVCLPHGWGHDAPGTRLSVAARQPGVSSNLLTDEALLDPLSGTSVLNGIPVKVTPA